MTGAATTDTHAQFRNALESRILVLDGAMGTMIQRLGLVEADYRGRRFEDHACDLRGNNDLLSLTRPELVADIHRQYFEAGADIVETNSFNATAISQRDYGMTEHAYELNRESARIARTVADEVTKSNPDRPRFVAGAIGPTSKTASMSPDVNDPGFRDVSFDDLRIAYGEAARGLVEGGADLLLIETVFDTLNAKAALFAIAETFEATGLIRPVMVSGTIADLSGRTLSGQTVEAFWYSVRHANPVSIGLNCALGPTEMRDHIADLSRVVETAVCAYPNAGLPNEFGEYDETPEAMAEHIREWAKSGLLNIVGGCCGTTPEHIAAIAASVEGLAPRRAPDRPPRLRLAGIEPLEVAA